MVWTELLPLWVLLPLLAAALATTLPARAAGRLAVLVQVALLAAWPWFAQGLLDQGPATVALAGHEAPLAIRLRLDGLGLLLLGLIAAVMTAAALHALATPGRAALRRAFWPAWLVLLAGLNAVVLAFDLFNMYVALELLTLAAVALVASAGSSAALAAAMRYLLLAMLGSLAWLAGVAIVHAGTGTLDLALAGAALAPGAPSSAAVALMLSGLLLKAAMFPLHGWLPLAHGAAPAAVSAVLSALVVKAAVLLVWRTGFWLAPAAGLTAAGTVLAVLGAAAIVWGSVSAYRQDQLKQVVAFSTVAQLGYLLPVLAMPVAAAWQGTVLHLLAHALAKSAMFLAAANLVRRAGDRRLAAMAGSDGTAAVSVFAFALAGVSLVGLPPSGGFLAKWLLLQGAWQSHAWWLVAILLAGSLLAAAYLFRALAAMLARPPDPAPGDTGRPVPAIAELAALLLALAAIALGFAGAPVLSLAGAHGGSGAPP